MRHTLLRAAALAATVVALTACGDTGDGDEPAADCSPPDDTLAVGALESISFDEDAYEVGAGCVEITLTNEGAVAHTLLVRGKSGFKLSVGDTDSGSLELTPGDYELYCDIAGHTDMTAELAVD